MAVNWLPLAQDTGQYRALVVAAAIIRVLRNVTVWLLIPLFDSWKSISFAALRNLFARLLFCWSVGWLVSFLPRLSQSVSQLASYLVVRQSGYWISGERKR
jgi:hypothetical protein